MAQGRYSYSTQVRPSDAPILDQNASASNQMSMMQFAAFDRVMQQLLGFGVDMYDRNQAKERYQMEQDRLARAEQRGVEATAEERRRYEQQWQFQQEGQDFTRLAGVIADPRLAALQRGGRLDQPGAPIDYMAPLEWTAPEQPGVPRDIDIASGSPSPTGFAPSRLAVAEQQGLQSQREERLQGIAETASKMARKQQLAGYRGQLDNEVQRGTLAKEDADRRYGLAVSMWSEAEAAEAAALEADRKFRLRMQYAGSGVQPKVVSVSTLERMAAAGNLAGYNAVASQNRLPTFDLRKPADAAQWVKEQERAKANEAQRQGQGEVIREKLHQAKFDAFAAAGDVDAAVQYALDNDIPRAVAEGAYKQGQIKAQTAIMKSRPKTGLSNIDYAIREQRKLLSGLKKGLSSLPKAQRKAQAAAIAAATEELAALEERREDEAWRLDNPDAPPPDGLEPPPSPLGAANIRGDMPSKAKAKAASKPTPLHMRVKEGQFNSISRQRVPKEQLAKMSSSMLQNILSSSSYDIETKAAVQIELNARRAAAMQPKIGRP